MDTIQYFLMYCPPQRKSSAEEWLEAQHSRATDDIAKYVVLSKSIFSPVLLLSLWKLLACVTDSGPRIKTFIKYVEISICDTINYTAKNAMPVYCSKFWEMGISLFSAAEEAIASVSHLVTHDIFLYR